MVSPHRIRTTWVLTALFVAVVGIDEGWHLNDVHPVSRW